MANINKGFKGNKKSDKSDNSDLSHEVVVVKFAIGYDYLDKDPFLLYKAKSVKKEGVVYTIASES